MAFERLSQLNMSDEIYDFVCTSCSTNNKTVEAVKYCEECSYCCQSCTDAHGRFLALRRHNLMDVSQGDKASELRSSLLEIPTERCSIHKGNIVDMYCGCHDVVGCARCFITDHKFCQRRHIHSIPDMIDTIFKLSDCKQTHGLLKDMMVSMETVSKSKDTQLQTLSKAKQVALGQVNTFQKALEAILSKIAESSRKEIEVVYKRLETEILHDKQRVDSISKDLQTIDEKLNEIEVNRAQRFVCTKIAKDKIKVADGEKVNQELQHNTDVQISFIPHQSLMEYMQALQGIGQVQKHYRYKIKESRDITIKLARDSKKCYSLGCCLTNDDQLLVTDYDNKKLKRVDVQKMSIIDYCTLDSLPNGVCCISKHEVAVACWSVNKIQFVSIHSKMKPTRQINMSHVCYGIAFNDGKLYVTDLGSSLYVYDVTGSLLKTFTRDNAGNKLFANSKHITFNESGDRMFVGGGDKGLVCYDGMGNYLSSIKDTDLAYVDGGCVDGRGNMFVIGNESPNVVQFSEKGKKLGVLVKQGDELQRPCSMCFHQGLNRLFVTMHGSNVVKMYELE